MSNILNFKNELKELQTVLDYQKKAADLVFDSLFNSPERKVCSECSFIANNQKEVEKHKEGECDKGYE